MSRSDPSCGSRRYAVIGGGISGLTASYRLEQLLPTASVELFEASGQLGGVLSTRREDGYLVEQGADSFIRKLPWAVELCEELGLSDQLIETNPVGRRALVVRDGRLHPVPEGFVIMRPHRIGPVLRTPLLTWRAKLRLFRERWVGSPTEIKDANYDESVASFATRRLGREVFEQLVQPLLAGIYTADPHRLSLAATMPEMIESERLHGSLTHAVRAKKRTAKQSDADSQESGARYASFVTLRGGLRQLVETLADRLPRENIHLDTKITSVSQTDDRQWTLQEENGTQHGPFDGIIVALPAPRAASLLESEDSELSELLGKISYASSAIVNVVYKREQIAHDLDGFGFVVPTVEQRDIVAASFSSVKFVDRAPDDEVLIRIFLGGALQPELVDLQDDQIRQLALENLDQLLGIEGNPSQIELLRWREKMPQYHVGHVQLVESIENRAAQLDGLELAGNAYHGVGIPQCVRSGDRAARRFADRNS